MKAPKPFRPMLAASIVDSDAEGSYKGLLSQVTWPKIVTPKIDGIRAVKRDGVLGSRRNLPIPNYHIQQVCRDIIPEGFDVELVVVDNNGKPCPYNRNQSEIMSDGGTPDFRAMVIDWYQGEQTIPYLTRLKLTRLELDFNVRHYFGTADLIPFEFCYNEAMFDVMLHQAVDAGYEGLCLRDPLGPYKFGRATFNEQYLLKRKLTEDIEATVVGFKQFQHNANPAEQDAFGLTKRSSHSANQILVEKLGALICHNVKWGEFEVGTGFTESDRIHIWNERDLLKGQSVTVRYMPYGSKDKPRHPSFKGFRTDL